MRALKLIFSSLLLAAAASAQPLPVGLEISPSTTLPGIPVSFKVTFTNRTSKPVAIPSGAVLVVTTAGGAHFGALWDGRLVARLEGEEKEVKNIPVVREVATDGTFMRPKWFFTSQLAQPGTYQLQLHVGDFSDPEQPLHVLMQQATAISNTVVLTVAEPKGPDAEVWNALLALGRGTWVPTKVFRSGGRELVERVLREQPDSPYAGWLVTMGTAAETDEKAEALRNWLADHPDDPHFEWRMLRVAEWEVRCADKYAETKPEKSKTHAKNAREALDKLGKARNKDVRERVKNRLEFLTEKDL